MHTNQGRLFSVTKDAITATILLCWMTLLASAATAATLSDEWQDLHGRCLAAVEADVPLNTRGLVERPPTFIARRVPNGQLGTRLQLEVLRQSARIVPTGIWAQPGGRFELHLLEYPTRAGTRAICEIFVARGARRLSAQEGQTVLASFRDLRAGLLDRGYADIETRGADRAAVVSGAPNPRGCPVVASVTHDGAFFRSAVSERAGVPDCGGTSLLAGKRRLQEQEGRP